MLLLPLGFISEESFEIKSATDLIRINGPQLLAYGMLQREGRNFSEPESPCPLPC